MRQEENKAGLPQPLGFRAHQVLVYDQLGRVVKVAKLGFPEAEIFRAFKRVAVFIGHRAKLAEVCIEDLQPTLHCASDV